MSYTVTPTDCTESGTDGDGTVTLLMQKLWSPRVSDQARKQKVSTNAPPLGKWRRGGRGSADPKSVTPAQRVEEFSNEEVTVSNGKLFCLACREELSLKRSIVCYHVKSKKHVDRKKKLQVKEAKERDIAAALCKMDESQHPKGETLPTNQTVFRVKIVRAFLRGGVPLCKIDQFRELLEEGGFSLTDRHHMSDIVVPLIHQQELYRPFEKRNKWKVC